MRANARAAAGPSNLNKTTMSGFRMSEFGKLKAPGAKSAGCRNEGAPGSEGVPGNEGVGEHVRTRFHFGAFAPVKLRTPEEIRTERRKPVSSAGSVWEELALPKCDPA